MTKTKNPNQKRALKSDFSRLPKDSPLVPPADNIDLKPYQSWAEEKLGFKFDNPSLLVVALTHRSYVNEHRHVARAHNERLEFLGDAVLELITTDFLFRNFDQPEGILTSWRAALVRTESIRDAGDNLNYAALLRMSKGEKNGSEQAKLHIIANAFEALIGAIYLDKGFDITYEFVDKHILSQIDDILENGSWRDPKSHLQEVSQREDSETPDYRVLDEIGPDHEKIFTVGVFIKNVEMGRGEGTSKQSAQQNAAKEALSSYRKRRNLKLNQKKN